MSVERASAAAVRDGDHVAQATGPPARPGDASTSRGEDGGAAGGGEVESRMELVVARAEAVADHCRDRTREADGRAARRSPESAGRAGPGDSVASQTRPALEAHQRGLEVRSVAAVDGAGGKAMPREQELDLRDVEATG